MARTENKMSKKSAGKAISTIVGVAVGKDEDATFFERKPFNED